MATFSKQSRLYRLVEAILHPHHLQTTKIRLLLESTPRGRWQCEVNFRQPWLPRAPKSRRRGRLRVRRRRRKGRARPAADCGGGVRSPDCVAAPSADCG